MSKLLITGGCSFSECISTHIDTWPRHLARTLSNYEHVPTALGSQGNGLISRRIIYEVQSSLRKGFSSEDILVCIMWSGPDRFDTFFSHFDDDYQTNTDNWMINPCSFVKDSDEKGWYIFNHHWQSRVNKIYYKEIYDEVMAKIQTLEHILRVQWFLKSLGIKYVMTTYMNHVLADVQHPECLYLYNLIDKNHFLPINGQYEWLKENSVFEFPNKNDPHPGTEQHKEFVTKVLHPFLKKIGYVA